MTSSKVFALLCIFCFLQGVIPANRYNELPPRRSKRGLLSSLFGNGGNAVTETQTQVLPVYGDPAKPPIHMLYGHGTHLSQPYSPYSIVLIPNGHHGLKGSMSSSYIPVIPYSGVRMQQEYYNPSTIDWPVKQKPQPSPVVERPNETKNEIKTPTRVKENEELVPKSDYMKQLNLTPAEESELKRLAKLLGVTDFEHLPPFEDVKALLGTSTAGETIKAIKEYASTPDGLELIKDYVMSYQPAKRISLGKNPYSENEIDTAPLSSTTSTTAQSESGFYAHLRRLRSFLTFGYYGASETPKEEANAETTVSTTTPAMQMESNTNIPLEHYIIPIHPLPSTSNEPLNPSAMIPYPPNFFYPVISPLQTINSVAGGNEKLAVTTHDSNDSITMTDLSVAKDNLIEIKETISNPEQQIAQGVTDTRMIEENHLRGREAPLDENVNVTDMENSNFNVEQSNKTVQDGNVPPL